MARKLEDLQAKEKPEAVAAAEAKTSNTLFEIRLSRFVYWQKKRNPKLRIRWTLSNQPWRGLKRLARICALAPLNATLRRWAAASVWTLSFPMVAIMVSPFNDPLFISP